MKKISLLDCTLRDGGFLNDWNFGYVTSNSIFRRLVKSNIDIIEIGFINDKVSFDIEKTINPNTKSFDEIFKFQEKGQSNVVAMIDYGTCSLDNIALKEETLIDGIRVIFKKKDMIAAINFCHELKNKGYKVYTNPVSITTYSDREMLDLIELINNLKPSAMSLVDTYGLLHKDRLFRYFYLLDNNLNKEIAIGYHSHNNFQLAYSNSIELLNIKTDRNIILDSSLYGMGKTAGNCNTELLAMYLNVNFDKKYDIPEILNVIELDILKYTKEFSWGYQFPFYLSALNDCHPSYVKYLEKKNMLPVKDIYAILQNLDEEKKLSFNEQHVEALYQEYMKSSIDDKAVYSKLKDLIYGRQILLLGPGVSIKTQQNKITKYIETNNPLVISVNNINTNFYTDLIFISNPKRFDQYLNSNLLSDNIGKLIATSNIKDAMQKTNYILNWDSLKSSDTIVGESSLYILLKILIKLQVNEVFLAGFDGFSKYAKNYYNKYQQFYHSQENISQFTNAIIEQLTEFQKFVKIEFLTDSIYTKPTEVSRNV